MTAQGSKTRPSYMLQDNSVVCGRCVFDALKVRADNTDRTGEEEYEASKVMCPAPTETAVYVSLREHNTQVHGVRATRALVAVIGDDEKWHLVDIPEPVIQI